MYEYARTDMPISFPGLFGDWSVNPSPIAIPIGNGIRWYGIIICAGLILAVLFCCRQGKKYGITEDNVYDMMIWQIPLCIIGARIYYVLFYLDLYRTADGGFNWGKMIAVWDGGLAIYGAVIVAFFVLLVFCRKKKLSFGAFADLGVMGLLIGQAVGRWGNFVNREVFGGETAECVCQGLLDIFEFIGGVPPPLIFDNATGVGHRIGGAIHESELFSRFRAHYHFRVRFCNPYSGWEKGNVERKVGYNRANLFVPVPHFTQIEKYNQKLLLQHDKKAEELHYKKQVPIRELFEEDRKALLVLPPKRFNVCRYEWLQADGYGKVCMDGKHFYSTAPENAHRKVLTGIRAHTIDILTDGGQLMTSHRRMFGEGRTDVSDYSTTLAVLMKNSGAWHDSGLRRETPDILRAYMDAQPKEKLKNCLRIMNELTNQYGFQAAASAMEMAASRGNVNICDASVLAARITGYGIETPPQPGPSLSVYDETFLRKGGDAS